MLSIIIYIHVCVMLYGLQLLLTVVLLLSANSIMHYCHFGLYLESLYYHVILKITLPLQCIIYKENQLSVTIAHCYFL